MINNANIRLLIIINKKLNAFKCLEKRFNKQSLLVKIKKINNYKVWQVNNNLIIKIILQKAILNKLININSKICIVKI